MCPLGLAQVTGSTSGETRHQAAGDFPVLFGGVDGK